MKEATGALKSELEKQKRLMENRVDNYSQSAYNRTNNTATRIERTAENTPVPVTVYTSDGVKVGTVGDVSDDGIMVMASSDGSAETMTVTDGEAKFNAQANAIVLDKAHADLKATGSAGY